MKSWMNSTRDSRHENQQEQEQDQQDHDSIDVEQQASF